MQYKNLKTFGKQRSLRLKEFDYSRPFAYFVTICASRKMPYFEDKETAQALLNILLELKSAQDYQLYCYCIMPNHIHLLLNPGTSGLALPKFVRMLKSKTAVLLLKQKKIIRLWQRSYFEHILRKSEDLVQTVDYILSNPVRKGLVEHYQDYEFCGIVDRLE